MKKTLLVHPLMIERYGMNLLAKEASRVTRCDEIVPYDIWPWWRMAWSKLRHRPKWKMS